MTTKKRSPFDVGGEMGYEWGLYQKRTTDPLARATYLELLDQDHEEALKDHAARFVWVAKWECCDGSVGGETNGIVGVHRTEDAAMALCALDADEWHKGKEVVVRPGRLEDGGEVVRIDHHDGTEFLDGHWDIWYDVEEWEVRS